MENRCLITGGNGYVGSVLVDGCKEGGLEPILLQRGETQSGDSRIKFALGDPIPNLPSAQMLIHCAYDFKALTWKEIYEKNVLSSIELFQAAKKAGIQKLIFISSVSAYEGCRSLYGKAKLLVEEEVIRLGGVVIRPGLVYGERPGGMVGKLKAVSRLKVIPIVGGSIQMYLCHDEDLKGLIKKIIASDVHEIQGKLFTAASQHSMSFQEIVKTLSLSQNNSPLFIPIPWQLGWLGLKLFECMGKPLSFKSDSLVSLMRPNPRMAFDHIKLFGASFREPLGEYRELSTSQNAMQIP